MRLRAFTVLATLALAGCDIPLLRTPEPPLGPQLTGAQIQSLLSGNSLVTPMEQVPPLTLYFDESGEMRGIRANNYRDSGRWRIRDDTVCGQWENWMGTMASCWKVFRANERITLKSVDDARVVPASLAMGNVGGL
jgi:hypothetical protein